MILVSSYALAALPLGSLAEVAGLAVDGERVIVDTGGGVAVYAASGALVETRARRAPAVSAADAAKGVVERARWEGRDVELTIDGRLRVGAAPGGPAFDVDLPGPGADMAVRGDTLRVAATAGALELGPRGARRLRVLATAVGEGSAWGAWGTLDGAVVGDDGRRVTAVPGGAVTALGGLGDAWFVGTTNGLWRVGDGDTRRVDPAGLCGGFVTGLTRWRGDLVVSTFDGGACVARDGAWESLPLPSPMTNDALAVGDTLWIATAAGLVAFDAAGARTVVGEVPDEAPRGAPGTNHDGVNGLAANGDALWAVDVLGPVKVGPEGWQRYRWAVSGHSYQAVAACATGEVWVGSEDDGLAVTGVPFGRRNGRSSWRHVSVSDGLPEDWVMAVACAGRDAAWIGTYREGVGRMDARGWHPVAGLEGAWTQVLAVDGADLWVGTADGAWVVRDGVATQVSVADTWAILPEESGVWLGTRAGLEWVGRGPR